MVGCALKPLERFQFPVLYLSEKNGVATRVVTIVPDDPYRSQVEIGVVQGIDAALLGQIGAGPTNSIHE